MPRTPDTALAAAFTPITHATAPSYLNPSLHPLPHPLNVLILGASRGIGAGIARAYAQAGAGTLILAARASSASELRSVAAEITAACPGVRVHCLSVDITSSESMSALASQVAALCALDVVVLNAGYSGPVVLRVTDGEPGDFADVFDVNVQGTYLAARHLVPVLKDAGGARAFVVVGSWASCITKGHIANTAYCVSKFAQARLVEFVAEQYRDEGVVAFAVHPGAVNTEMADKTTPESFRSCKLAMRRCRGVG
jgi:NAD(P)-dependent dehydrogenase (short-subunit alcohol dehydrogenase family)